MKIIIHIGVAKTGTSAIQMFLHTNRDLLKSRGVLYPISGQFNDHSHHKLAFSFAPDGYRDDSSKSSKDLLDEIECELGESLYDTMVLSSECFPCLLDFDEFRKRFESHEIYVVCFLRDPASYVESWYRQWVKDTEIQYSEGFDVFFEKYSHCIGVKSKIKPWLNYVPASHVVVKDFDEIKKNGDICEEFLGLLGMFDFQNFTKISEVNQSLGYVGTRMMEVSNSLGSDPARNKMLSFAMGIKDYDDLVGARIISNEQSKIMHDLYANENNELLNVYSEWS